ncbi:hypothetical protein M408DRAFT_98996 [Serendipita vermifera MAFF 305830]|uniref:Uncharacterized protein n=1 Tax=Serendipita vermifera MAFF 305830 TaxID=933852 RepID=A0A0C2WUQ7_SERVB|nr:hypothetical protein M408DRAFT_98996 [Serendipita vermifera MAFF 305830]
MDMQHSLPQFRTRNSEILCTECISGIMDFLYQKYQKNGTSGLRKTVPKSHLYWDCAHRSNSWHQDTNKISLSLQSFQGPDIIAK